MCTFFFNVVFLPSFLVSGWFVFSMSTVPVGFILWLCFNELSILILLFPVKFNLALALISFCYLHFQGNVSWRRFISPVTFWCTKFFSWILCLCPQDSFLFHGRFGALTAEQNTNLLVSDLKKMKGGLILFFFFCMFHNKPVHELGQDSINCAVTHTGSNYLVSWKTISL